MRAAVIERFGEPPVIRERDEPKADSANVIEVTAAPLNPVDLSIATGKFYGGTPPLPYVPGGEGIGHPRSGVPADRVYFRAAPPNGALAERAVANGQTVPLPEQISDGVAAALGTPGIAAYLAMTRRAQLQPGETVLVLGASGVLGSIAVQVAKLIGAGRRLVEYAAAGKIKVEVEVLPLEAAPDAWKRQATSPHRKLVLSPRVEPKR